MNGGSPAGARDSSTHLPPSSHRSTHSSFSPSRSSSSASSTILRGTISLLDVFDVGERIAAQIVLRFHPAAISNQVPPKNPLVRHEFKVLSRFFPVLRE